MPDSGTALSAFLHLYIGRLELNGVAGEFIEKWVRGASIGYISFNMLMHTGDSSQRYHSHFKQAALAKTPVVKVVAITDRYAPLTGVRSSFGTGGGASSSSSIASSSSAECPSRPFTSFIS